MSVLRISAIVPTIGRPESLRKLFDSLAGQSRIPDEVLIADASEGNAVADLIAEPKWQLNHLALRHLRISPPNAVAQRTAAIAEATGDLLLLLDDDVILEPECVEELSNQLLHNPHVVAVCADFNNYSWPQPTRAWRLYLWLFHGRRAGSWQGKILGPLLRFGYCPTPAGPVPMDWLGAGNSMIRRDVFNRVGGFSDFFLHRCTMNEDVDLGIKLRREGAILLCPAARLGHFHAASGRVPPRVMAEDDLYNRYRIMHDTLGYSKPRSFLLVWVYFFIESASHFLGAVRRVDFVEFKPRFKGRIAALYRIAFLPGRPRA